MEFEDAHYNLRAIRLLYRLLEDYSLALQDENSEIEVVERARVLLRSLMDVAVESVFETHLKITATQAAMSKSSIEQEKPVAESPSKSPMETDISQSSTKYPTCSEVTSQKDEQPQLKLQYKKELPDPSNIGISDTGVTKSKTLNSLGEEKNMMQQNLVKGTDLSNEKGNLPYTESSNPELQHDNLNTSNGVGDHTTESLQKLGAKTGESNEDNNLPSMNKIHEAPQSSSVASQVESLDQMGDFSDDLVHAIKRIESRILAFQIFSNMVDSPKNSSVHRTMQNITNLESPEMQRNDGAAISQLNCRRSLLEGRRLTNLQTNKSSCKGENLISENEFKDPFLSGNESLSQSHVAYPNHVLRTDTESAKSVDIPKQDGTQLVSEGKEFRSQTRIQPSAQNKTMIERAKSVNRLAGCDPHLGSQASDCNQGLRDPLNQDDLTKKPSRVSNPTNRESLVRKTPVAWSKTDQHQKERSSELSFAQKLMGSTPNVPQREKPQPHQMVIKPTLLDQRSSEIKVNSHQHRDWSVLDRRGAHKTGHDEPRKTRVQSQHYELDESSSNLDSSSHWTSQQGSANSSSGTEDYSLQVGTQGPADAEYEGSSEESSNSYLYKSDGSSHRVGSLNSYRYHSKRNPKKNKVGHDEPRKTIVQPQHHEVEESNSNSDSSHWTSQQGSANSSGDSLDYSLPIGTEDPTIGRLVDAAYEGSSEESSNSYLYKSDGPSRRVGSPSSYRYHRKRNPKKTIGSLRKLKNKLGLIFHHHHHHHHHHHDDDNGNLHSDAGHRHSMWSHLQNVFHHKNKHGMLTKHKVGKSKRGAIARVNPRSNQVGQFHRLVEGLLRHIRHSKKPKHGRVKRSRYTPHGHSQKKLHWWHILGRRRGVKLKSGGRVKVGFISQKSLKN